MRIAAIGGKIKEPILGEFITDLPTSDVLIIPTACSTPRSYNSKVPACTRMFTELGLTSAVLHEYDQAPTPTAIEHELGRASLVYVIGGNSPYMLEKMPEHGTDAALRAAVTRGDVALAGTSAGALLPFSRFMSCPAKQPAEEDWQYTYLKGLDIIPAAATAHANQHDKHLHDAIKGTRYDNFSLPKDTAMGFAIENNAALVIDGERAYVGRSAPEADVYLVAKGSVPFAIRDDEQLSAIMKGLYAHHKRDECLPRQVASVTTVGTYL